MPRKVKVFDQSLKVGHPWNQIYERDCWLDGCVVTEHSIVQVYSQGDDQHLYFTSLSLVKDGVWHDRNISGKRYTQRGLVTLAKRYAAEVFSAE